MSDNNNKSSAASYVLSASICMLAGSFCYMAYTVADFTKEVPGFVKQMSDLNENGKKGLEYLPTADKRIVEVNATLADITKELEGVRKLTPDVMKEFAKTREMVPSVLKRVDKAQEQFDQMHKDMPMVLETIKEVNGSVSLMAKESANFRPVLGEFSSQIKQTRAEIPTYFREAHGLIEAADQVGSKASEGAVAGIFSGILKSPFNVVKSFVTGKKELTEQDHAMIKEAGRQTLRSGEKSFWDNQKSGSRGSVSAGDEYKHKGQICRALMVEYILGGSNKAQLSTQEVCRYSSYVPWRKD